MARYYLILDYLIPVSANSAGSADIYALDNFEEKPEHTGVKGGGVAKSYTILSLSPKLQLRIVFHSSDKGRFLIKAPNRYEAYALGDAIKGYFALEYDGLIFDTDLEYFLNEIDRVPQSSWTRNDLLTALKKYQSDLTELDAYKFTSGVTVHYNFESLSKCVSAIYKDRSLNESLSHVNQSLALFGGWMPGSYYSSNYIRERKQLTRWDLEKRYLEMRPRYEVAFLAAFKAIERFMRVNDIKKHLLKNSFIKLPYPDVKFSSKYSRFHEIFSGLPKRTTNGEIISHFLDIRNTVAAHANQNPPARFIVSEDSLFEIQLFVKHLIIRALDYYDGLSEEQNA